MEVGRGKGGDSKGKVRGGQGLTYENIFALSLVFFEADMAVPGFLSRRGCVQQPLQQIFPVFLRFGQSAARCEGLACENRRALFLTFFRTDVAPGTDASTIPCFLRAFGNNASRRKT